MDANDLFRTGLVGDDEWHSVEPDEGVVDMLGRAVGMHLAGLQPPGPVCQITPVLDVLDDLPTRISDLVAHHLGVRVEVRFDIFDEETVMELVSS